MIMQIIQLVNFKKKKDLFFTFFPKALTAGCTLETKAYNDLYKEFLAYG